MLSSSKPHCQTLFENVTHYLKYFRETTFPSSIMLLHRPKFQIFSAESNMMFKVVRYLSNSEAAVCRCLQPFKEKSFFMSIFFTKAAGLQPKARLRQRCFPVSLSNISEHFFCERCLRGNCFS